MTTTTREPAVGASNEVNVFEFRKTARKRAMICPGAGFDYMGRPVLGLICYAASVATLLLAIGVTFSPSKTMLLGTLALVVVGTILWWLELFATLAAWPSREPRRTKFNPWWGAAGICALLVIFAVCTFTSFKLATFGGMHMSPTIVDEETLLFHRHVDDDLLRRGTLILFTLDDANKIDEPGKLTLGRIIAAPGDVLTTTKEGRYMVNGEMARHVAPSGMLPIAIRIPPGKKLTIPPGCYFVAQDSLEEGFDSRVLGYAKRERIVSTKMFRFNKAPFLGTIE